jgi:hypothetical protein
MVLKKQTHRSKYEKIDGLYKYDPDSQTLVGSCSEMMTLAAPNERNFLAAVSM